MPVLAAQCEREAGRVAEAGRSAVDDLGYERQCLQGSRAQIFGEQERCKIAEVAFVTDCEHGAEAFEIDIFGAHVMMCGHDEEAAGFSKGRVRVLPRNGEQCILGGKRAAVGEVQDDAFIAADDAGVGLAGKVAHRRRVPVVAAGESRGVVHPLLDDGPVAGGSDDEGMQVKLEAIADGVVVDFGGEATAADEFVSGNSGAVRDGAQFIRRAARLFAAAPAEINAEFVRARVESAFEGTEDGGRNAGGMPVHAHHGAERLEPEGIADTREEFRLAVMVDDGFDDGRAEFLHAFGEPRRDAAAVQGKIGKTGALHMLFSWVIQ